MKPASGVPCWDGASKASTPPKEQSALRLSRKESNVRCCVFPFAPLGAPMRMPVPHMSAAVLVKNTYGGLKKAKEIEPSNLLGSVEKN